MQNSEIINSLDNEWQLIAYLTQKNQSTKTEQKPVEEKNEELDHVHELAHENEENIQQIASAMTQMQNQLDEIREEITKTNTSQQTQDKEEQEAKVKCSVCGDTYNTKAGLASHLNGVHGLNGEGIVDQYMEKVETSQSPETVEVNTEQDKNFECLVNGCNEDFSKFHLRNMHLSSHSAEAVARVIEGSSRANEIYKQARSVGDKSFNNALDSRLEQPEKYREEENTSISDKDEETYFKCPECGQEYKSIQGVSNHVTQNSDHATPSDLLKDNGEFVCNYCSESFESSELLSSHLKNHDTSIVREYIKEFDSDEENRSTGDDVYDEQGNVKALQGMRERIDKYNNDQLEEKVYNYLSNEQVAKEQGQIHEDLFEKRYKSGTKEYSKLYDVMQNSDRIHVATDMGRTNKYYTDEAMKEQAKHSRVKQKAIDEIGDERWKLFIRAIKELLPENDNSTEITYYDFSGEYMGDEEYPSERIWRLFALPHNTWLRNALKQVASGDIEFEIKEPEGVPRGTSKYRDNETVKRYKVKVTHG